MNGVIVHSDAPVTLVGGGEAEGGDLRAALALAPCLVAADGGASLALASGHMPRAVIGDFDSLPESDRARIPAERLFAIHEQESTDFDKALRSIAAPLVLAVGFLGGRLDHQLAALSTLARRLEPPCIMLGPDEVIFHVPQRLALPLHAGEVVSLFPMAPVTGRSRGLEWPIDGLDLTPSGRVGTSNRALGAIELEMNGPGLLAITPRRALADVAAALARPIPQR